MGPRREKYLFEEIYVAEVKEWRVSKQDDFTLKVGWLVVLPRVVTTI